MENEHAEIVAALAACSLLPGSFDKTLIKHWDRQRTEEKPLSETGARHIYRFLHKYRAQMPEVYAKYQNHSEILKYQKQHESSANLNHPVAH